MKQSIILLVLLLNASAIFAFRSSCDGSISGINYTLVDLSNITARVKDNYGNMFLYQPCTWLHNEHCMRINEIVPAVCQHDNRTIRQYHDCGSSDRTAWYERNEGSNTGFFIEFSGGEFNRKTMIEFICDRNIGIGKLELASPAESPKYHYHMQWRSQYACPV